jgi:hypothetical protein
MLQLIYNMNLSRKHFITVFSLAFLILPALTSAQSVSLTAGKTTYTTNDSILVTVSVQTGGQQINTVGGQVNFSPAISTISDVRYGNSIISLWVEKPSANNSLGAISFTGGVPGGFGGSSGTLFTFVVKPKTEGSLTLGLKDIHVLLNDGSGGELQGLKLIPLTLNITKAKAGAPKETPPPTEKLVSNRDAVSPEAFVPMVSHHESIANDSYFVSFFAVDKNSGVEKYEVREVYKFLGLKTDWVETVSPHVLSVQAWGTKVLVRATDGAGNSVVASADKPFSSTLLFVFVLILLVLTVILTRTWVKRQNRARRK